MKLYLISQNENNDYDTFDSAVVCAPDEATARLIRVGNYSQKEPFLMTEADWNTDNTWCSSPDKVIVQYLGEAAPELRLGEICSSFNAG